MPRKSNQRWFIAKLQFSFGRTKTIDVVAGGQKSAERKASKMSGNGGIVVYCILNKKKDQNVGKQSQRRWL